MAVYQHMCYSAVERRSSRPLLSELHVLPPKSWQRGLSDHSHTVRAETAWLVLPHALFEKIRTGEVR
jgi:hypothetical protein